MVKDLYTPSEFARMMGVHALTVTSWCREGQIRSQKTVGGHCRIPRSEVERVLGHRLGETLFVTPEGLKRKGDE